MQIKKIYYTKRFEQQFSCLSKTIQKKALKTEKLFRENAFHPSLRLHKLKGKFKGCWSISVDRRYRIILDPSENGEIVFLNIGMHAIYD